MRKVTVLLSGGIDSLVTAELYRERGELGGLVFIDYGHPAQTVEGWKAFAYAGKVGMIDRFKTVHWFGSDLGEMGTSHGARVVPGRNLALIALAANVAPSLGCDAVALGCNAADAEDYPDCRHDFLVGVSNAMAWGKSGVSVRAPLLEKSKAEIIAMAKGYGLTRDDAWSCYGAGPGECGLCPSCVEALGAWGEG